MKDTPYKFPRPAGLDDYIIKCAADQTYIIFNRKHDVARCTRCGKYFKLSDQRDVMHNSKTYCPACGDEAIAKEERYGRKNITEYGRILWFRKYGRVTYAQLDEYQIDYTGIYPKVTFWPSAQYKFSKNEQEYYKHVPAGWWKDECWEKRKNVILPAPVAGLWNYYKMPKYQKTVTHSSVISSIGTDLRYAKLNMSRLGYGDPHDPYILIRYIAIFLKYPSVEILEKAGFENIVRHRIRYGCRHINWKGKTLQKILKLNMGDIRTLRESKNPIDVITMLNELKKRGYTANIKKAALVAKAAGHPYHWQERLEHVGKRTDIIKAAEYIISQNERYDRYNDLGDYRDYLEECEKLQRPLTDRKILRPKDFQMEHARLSAELEVKLNAEKIKNFCANETIITGMTEPVTKDGLIIRPAAEPKELIIESEALGHCVRTYVDKVARGESAILFVRKAEDRDTPYYTLELSSGGRIIQCRGKHNRPMTEEVETFVNKWHEEWKKRKETA